MALIWCEGFDAYNTTLLQNGNTPWQQAAGTATIEAGRFAGYCLQIPDTYLSVYRIVPTNMSTIYIQFAFKMGSYVQAGIPPIVLFYDAVGAGGQCRLGHDGTGKLGLYNGDTLVNGSSVVNLLTGTWHYLEVKVTIHNTAGSWFVKCDGNTVMDYSNINTRFGTTNSYANRLYFAGSWQHAGANWAWDDMIVMDNTGSYCNNILGNRSVRGLMPTANGDYAQWTPSTGQNFECVNEIPPNGDTDYNATVTAGNKDTFVVPDIAANAVVDAVAIDMYVKTADPSAVTMKGLARSNDQDGEGNVVTVPSSYAYLQSIIYRDPNGDIAWTGSSFNAAEFGYKKES